MLIYENNKGSNLFSAVGQETRRRRHSQMSNSKNGTLSKAIWGICKLSQFLIRGHFCQDYLFRFHYLLFTFTTMYKLDRAAFKIQTFKEADLSICYGKDVSIEERLRRSFYLTAQNFRFDVSNPPRLDRMHFEMKKIKY